MALLFLQQSWGGQEEAAFLTYLGQREVWILGFLEMLLLSAGNWFLAALKTQL
jgi:hypothetical protein